MLIRRMRKVTWVGAYKKSWILGFWWCVSFSKMIQPFSGEGNVIAWLKKVDLVASPKGIPNVASLIPLFLEGDALVLYLELSDEDKKDANIIRIQLMRRFSKNPCEAYEKFKKMKWTGEWMYMPTRFRG